MEIVFVLLIFNVLFKLTSYSYFLESISRNQLFLMPFNAPLVCLYKYNVQLYIGDAGWELLLLENLLSASTVVDSVYVIPDNLPKNLQGSHRCVHFRDAKATVLKAQMMTCPKAIRLKWVRLCSTLRGKVN